MSVVRSFAAGLRRLLRRSGHERDLDDEVAHFVAMAAREHERAGLAPDEALRAARLAMGGVENVKERVRGGGWEASVENAARDVRYGLRTLRRNPVFAAVVIGTLALGIGANTAVFSVVNTVLLRSLPYRDPGRLVRLWESRVAFPGSRIVTTGSTLAAWRARTHSFEAIAAWARETSTDTGGVEPEELVGAAITPNLFRSLGVRLERGRDFTDDDAEMTAPDVVILSHAFWMRRFGGDSAALGRTIALLQRRPFTVVGVVADLVGIRDGADFWVPLRNDQRRASLRWLSVVARLRPGVGERDAARELADVQAQLAVEDPASHAGWGSAVASMYDALVGNVKSSLWVLFGAVGFVLLIACANVANLFLARAASRQREVAVRSAIGASMPRLLRQLLTESGLLALVGGAVGLLLAWWSVRLIAAQPPPDIPRLPDLSIDWRVLAFTAVATIAVSLLSGLAPAFRLAGVDLSRALREGASDRGSGGASLRRPGARALLVIVQMALAVALLSGAGLMINSFARMQRVALGFDPGHAAVITLAPAFDELPGGVSGRVYYSRIVRELSGVPGVRDAAVATAAPLNGAFIYAPVWLQGHAPVTPADTQRAYISIVSDRYFEAIGAHVRDGRGISPEDVAGAPPVVVVNHAFVRQFLGGQRATGRTVTVQVGSASERIATIAGVVDDVKQFGVRDDVEPDVYFPFLQFGMEYMDIVVRTVGDPAQVLPAVHARLREVDANAPITRERPLTAVVSDSIAQPRFYTLLIASFALLGVALAAVGLYGLVSYSVTRRTHEIGMRISLGARPAQIVRMVIGQGLALISIGVVAGVAVSLMVTRLLRGLLFGVAPTDPSTLAAITFVLVAVSLAACWVPARRATRVDPLVALRHE